MRIVLVLASAAFVSACASEALDGAPVILPRPSPLAPEPPLGTFGPVLEPEVTVPYYVD